ncbi:hypothetical protein SDC9_177784 [bioreactor metagenome]|uniref:Uncharacterized protein n=1 Tax=bioreactor metagenome TaxID=1076179 RepID=A0A645H3A5_9ZZZZ
MRKKNVQSTLQGAKKMTQSLISKKLRPTDFGYSLRNHGANLMFMRINMALIL